ncbi:MAG: hypothetical protein ACOYM3_01680 [Terrimicrobiaceae bacterium]
MENSAGIFYLVLFARLGDSHSNVGVSRREARQGGLSIEVVIYRIGPTSQGNDGIGIRAGAKRTENQLLWRSHDKSSGLQNLA